MVMILLVSAVMLFALALHITLCFQELLLTTMYNGIQRTLHLFPLSCLA